MYPPEHHVLRDLALEVQSVGAVNRAWMPVTDNICNARGRVHTGLVATMIDAICGGLAAVAAAPGWIATADLTMHVVQPLVGDELGAVAKVRRAGRTTVVLEAEVFADGNEGDPLAVATATFSVLERRDANPILTATGDTAESRHPFVGRIGSFAEPAYSACGFRSSAHGIEVDVHEYILNSLGGVQGGVLACLSDAAVVQALGTEFETVDLHLVYLALAKQGPIRAVPTVLRRGDANGSVAIDMSDVGAGRRTTVANCVGVLW